MSIWIKPSNLIIFDTQKALPIKWMGMWRHAGFYVRKTRIWWRLEKSNKMRFIVTNLLLFSTAVNYFRIVIHFRHRPPEIVLATCHTLDTDISASLFRQKSETETRPHINRIIYKANHWSHFGTCLSLGFNYSPNFLFHWDFGAPSHQPPTHHLFRKPTEIHFLLMHCQR